MLEKNLSNERSTLALYSPSTRFDDFFCFHMQTSNDSKIRQNYHCVLAKALNRNSGPADKKGAMKENGVRSTILGWMGILRSRKSSS